MSWFTRSRCLLGPRIGYHWAVIGGDKLDDPPMILGFRVQNRFWYAKQNRLGVKPRLQFNKTKNHSWLRWCRLWVPKNKINKSCVTKELIYELYHIFQIDWIQAGSYWYWLALAAIKCVERLNYLDTVPNRTWYLKVSICAWNWLGQESNLENKFAQKFTRIR